MLCLRKKCTTQIGNPKKRWKCKQLCNKSELYVNEYTGYSLCVVGIMWVFEWGATPS